MRRKRFGTFEVDLDAGELRRGGLKVKLQEQPFQLLALLLERPGEVVTRETVRDKLWGPETFVDFDHGLNTVTRKLRQALGDSAETPRFVETVARRGYRFIADVVAVNGVPDSPAAQDSIAATAPPGPPVPAPVPEAPAQTAWWAKSLAFAVAMLLVAGGAAWLTSRALAERVDQRTAQSAAPPTRLAVLPFSVLTDERTDDPLGVGIADAIITQLASASGLRVLPTVRVIRYAGRELDPQLAGRELDVSHVLVGTLRKGSGHYRLAVQLLQTADGGVVWARNYDVPEADLLKIEDRVAAQVAQPLRVELSDGGRAGRRAPKNLAAYEPYLQARGMLDHYSEARMRAAIETFERALALDPDYALARSGLAIALAWFSVRYAYEPEALEWGRRAEEEASRALKLDPTLAEAHLAIASAAGTLYGGFNWTRALAEVDEALNIEPNVALGYTVRARVMYHLGLFPQSDEASRHALELHGGTHLETQRIQIASALFGGRFAEARRLAEALIKESDAPAIRTYLGTAIFYLGERQQAADLLASVRRGNRPDVRSQAVLAGVQAALGKADAARALIADITSGPYMDHHVAYNLGSAFAQLRRPADAVKWLRQAVDSGFPCYPMMMADPLLDPIRTDREFLLFLDGVRTRFDEAKGRYGT